MKILAFAVLLTVIQAAPKSADGLSVAIEKHKQTSQGSKEPNSNQCGTNESPCFMKIIPPEEDKKEAEYEQRHAANEKHTADATVAMAVISLFLAIFTALLWRITKTLAKDANASGNRAIEISQAAERAWLLVTVEMVSNQQKVKGGFVRFGFGFDWYVKNCGKTAAFITKIGARFHTVKDISELPEEPNIDISELVQPTDVFPYGFGLGPNESIERFTFSKEERPTSPEAYAEACAGKPIWIAYGVVEYRLIFEPERIRETRFCYVWMPGKEDSFVRSPIPAKYTKQT